MNKLDRFIFGRLFAITSFVLLALICIYILIDFSENSDQFADRGATLKDIWVSYYLNYIPEMIRLVSPLAVFIACLMLTGQMTERLEIIAIKASGVSLYRLLLPFALFGFFVAGTVSFLDAKIIPTSNAERIEFEGRYLGGSGDRIDRGGIYRQSADDMIVNFSFFDANSNIGTRVTIVKFNNDEIESVATVDRIYWVDSLSTWRTNQYDEKLYTDSGYKVTDTTNVFLDLNLYPRDLSRRSSDIYQLTYAEAFQYIDSIERIGAGGVSLPLTQLYSRIAYPIAIFVVSLIGFAIATERRKSGKGFYIAAGLAISFLYLVFMKVLEPIGSAGSISPQMAAFLPHILFLAIGIAMLVQAKK